MTTNDAGEELLAAVAAGERDENDPEVAALFARDPAARERLRRMRALTGELDRAGAEQREVLAGSSPVPPSHQQLVRAEVARGLRRRLPRGLLLAAALLALAAVIAVASLLPRAARPDDVLGPQAGDAYPQGVVAEYGEFRWNLALPRHGWFELVFLDDRDRERGSELFRVPGITEQRWTAEAAHRELMTDRMAWRVDVIESGQVSGSAGPYLVRRR